jgi:hypothetical protein
MRDALQTGNRNTIFSASQGVLIGTVFFFAIVFVLAMASANVDKSVLENKIAAAIRTSVIQFPVDFFGRINFTDCTVLMAGILDHGRLWSDMFDTLIYVRGVGVHHCDVLVNIFEGRSVAAPVYVWSYSRYWWGSAVIAKIALGMTGLSIKTYVAATFTLSIIARLIFIVTFFFAYGRVAFSFLPLFTSLWIGYGLLTLGPSIAYAPELIVGLFLLSAYNVASVQHFPIRARAVLYSFLGGICVYFDLLDDTLVLITILLCCQLIAPYAARLLSLNTSQAMPSYAALAREIVMNCSLVVIGGCGAIMLRVLGYSIVSHTNILEVATAWISDLSFRFSGSLTELGPNELHSSLYRVLLSLARQRQIPFYGFLSKIAADTFYIIGFAAWAIAMALCWKLHRRGVSPVTVAVGFVMAAGLVPAWFVVFEQHTIIHAWLTGRLVTLFCGLGMSLAVLAGWTLARTDSPNRREELAGCPGSLLSAKRHDGAGVDRFEAPIVEDQ